MKTNEIKGNKTMNPSTKAFLSEAKKTPGFSFLDGLHGYIYARFIYLIYQHWYGSSPDQ